MDNNESPDVVPSCVAAQLFKEIYTSYTKIE